MKFLKSGLVLLIIIATLGCGGSATSDSKAPVLSQMRQNLGLPGSGDNWSVYAMADCTGPSSVFKTLVMSNATSTRFEQQSGPRHILGIHRPDSAWLHDFVADTTVAVDNGTIAFLINHELHATAFYPESRYGQVVSEKDTVYYKNTARVLTFTDVKGAAVNVFYQAESWLPLGFSIENHLGRGAKQVDVLFDNWQEIEGTRVFTEARFLQGEDVYSYKFTKISFDNLSEGVFTKNEPLILP